MNRSEMAQAIAACDAMSKRLRAALTADAAAEFSTQGTVPTWKLPGITVVGSTIHPSVAVVDEAAFLSWVAERYPSEVETVVITRARPAWQATFLADVATRGEPPCDVEGEIVPGLQWRPGGGFGGIALRVDRDTKATLAGFAEEIVAGKRPLALPSEVTV